jgi:hypothetical protein
VRALLVIALLASAAHADGREETLRELARSLEHRRTDVAPCKVLLARLDAMHVLDDALIFVRGRRDVRTVGDARVECVAQERAAKVDAMVYLIEQAVRFPGAWAGQCMDAWPDAIANGLPPTERIDRIVSGRRGRVVLDGTLEQLRVKWCDNAYTPRRPGE